MFSPTVKDRYLELLPNLMIIDAIGSTRERHERHGHADQGPDRQPRRRRPHREGRRATPSVLDDDLRPLPRRLRRDRQAGPRRQHPDRVLQGPGQDGRHVRHRRRRHAATWSPATSPRSRPTARSPCWAAARSASTPAARRSSRRRSRRSLKAHPAVFDALVVGVPDDRWGQAVCRRRAAPPTSSRPPSASSTPTAAPCWPATRFPATWSLVDEIVRSPSGKPDYPWAAKIAGRRPALTATTPCNARVAPDDSTAPPDRGGCAINGPVPYGWCTSTPTLGRPERSLMSRPWSCLTLPPVRNSGWVEAHFGYR